MILHVLIYVFTILLYELYSQCIIMSGSTIRYFILYYRGYVCNLFILLPVGNIMVYLCYVTYIVWT